MGKEVRLLDCTLRDGGYLNDWQFGKNNIITLYERLTGADIDIVEIGFLDERRKADPDRSIYPDFESVNNIYQGFSKGNSMIVGMIDYGTLSIQSVIPCQDSFLDGIRVIFKKEYRKEALTYCGALKQLGYQIFVQAVSITDYSDEEFTELLDLVNNLCPYAFSVVDTYGLLHKNKLVHYFHIADERLRDSIMIGYHSHNNFQLGYANCIELMELNRKHTLLVDGSLYGMGKGAGNTPVELLAMYLNTNGGFRHYSMSQLLEAIDTTILDIRREIAWGYNLKFFLSASHDCHPNYVTYLTVLKKLSIKSINEILDQIPNEKKLRYDALLIEQLYLDYQKNECDDSEAVAAFREKLRGEEVLLLGPGKNLYRQRQEVEQWMENRHPFVIAVNFVPQDYPVKMICITNSKRYVQMATRLHNQKVLIAATSNITTTGNCFDYRFDYSRLLTKDALIVDNPLVMLTKVLTECGIKDIYLAGFDGYTESEEQNYVNPNMEYVFTKERAKQINQDTVQSVMDIVNRPRYHFITDTLYHSLCN